MDISSEALKTIINRAADEYRAEIVEVNERRSGAKTELKVLVDKTAGITLEECALINRKLAGEIEKENIFPGEYVVEVSSPGLDRPLKTEQDFRRALGRELKILTRKPVRGRCEYTGTLAGAGAGSITLALAEQGAVEIKTENILKAKYNLRW